MFEFECKGGMTELMELERECLEALGFGPRDSFKAGKYEDIAKEYGVDELDHDHEARLNKENGSVFFLTDFPNRTSPFWNMK